MDDPAASVTSVLSTCDDRRILLNNHNQNSQIHPSFLDLYKKRSNLSSQEERRKAILSEQKKYNNLKIRVDHFKYSSIFVYF